MRSRRKLKKAYFIVCDLLNDATYYGIDKDKLWELVMKEYKLVDNFVIANFVYKYLDRFSDNDRKRNRAIKKLGY